MWPWALRVSRGADRSAEGPRDAGPATRGTCADDLQVDAVVGRQSGVAWASQAVADFPAHSLEQLLDAHPDGDLVRSMPGMGTTLSPEFLAEVVSIQQFPTGNAPPRPAWPATGSTSCTPSCALTSVRSPRRHRHEGAALDHQAQDRRLVLGLLQPLAAPLPTGQPQSRR